MLTTLLVTSLTGDTPTPSPDDPYALPTASEFKAWYPAFAAVSDATIDARIAWVNGRDVDRSWSEADFRYGIMAAAAHRMVKAGVPGIAADQTSEFAAKGVTSFKSGSFNVSFSEAAANRASGTGWESTSYGADYLDLLRKRGISSGVTNVRPCCGYPDA